MVQLCGGDGFRQEGPGLAYKLISHRQDEVVAPGEVLKMHVKQVYGDSVLSDTRSDIPFYQRYDSATMSGSAYTIFGKVRKGDSLVFKALTDSAFVKPMPAFARPGEYLYTTVYVLDILGPRVDIESEMERERRKLERTDLPDMHGQEGLGD